MLEKMGFEVTIANDGRQAFEIVSRQPHDLILMDIQMSGMNGYEATEAIRRKGIRIPIIALTANAMKGDDKKCFDAGCDAYVSKPVNRIKLHELMKKYIMDRMDSAAAKIDSVQNQVDELNKLCDETLSGAEPDESDSPVDRKSSTIRPNCWEVKKCGRQPGGDRVAEPGQCPATMETSYDGTNGGKNGGRFCWKVAGTMCGGKVQGIYAQKLETCLDCDFFQQVQEEQSGMFVQ
jgi:CheY-like chemotaxis protein